MGFDITKFMSSASLQLSEENTENSNAGASMIPVSKLIPASGNFYSKDEDRIRKLAASIEMLTTEERLGIQQDLIVKPIEGTDTYEIIAGETRWAAVKLLLEEGRLSNDTVPCRVESSGDVVREELILILTNSTQRERSDVEKMQEIERLRELLTEYKKTHSLGGTMQQAIGDILGISKTKVGTLENIKHNLSDDLIEQYQNGSINTSVANKLAGQPPEVQKMASDILVSDGKMTASDVEKLAEGNIPEALESYPPNYKVSGQEGMKLEAEKRADEISGEYEGWKEADKDMINILDEEIIKLKRLINLSEKYDEEYDKNGNRRLKHQVMLDAYCFYLAHLKDLNNDDVKRMDRCNGG